MDSGDVYDTTLSGGRLGVLVFNQPRAQWSDLRYTCVDRMNEAMQFDGVDDYVEMPHIGTLGITNRFEYFRNLKCGHFMCFSLNLVSYLSICKA